MIGLVTQEARALAAQLEKAQREAGRSPLHAMAEGEAEEREKHPGRAELLADPEDDAEKGSHPETGRFTTGPRHPILTDGHARDSLGNIPATPRADPAPTFPAPMITPSPEVAVRQVTGEDHPERWPHPGNVPMQHLAFAAPPVPVDARPTQVPFHIAPTGSSRA
jgi:hypothetical protein